MNNEPFDYFADMDRIPTCRWIPECDRILLDDGCSTCHLNLFGNHEEIELVVEPNSARSD
jgi:hypothetical protein